MSDHRQHPRQRTLLSGMVVFDDGARSLGCTIRDLSESGAKIRLPGPEILPGTVWLIEMRSGMAHRCRVSWRTQLEAGLQFEQSHRLDQGAPEDFARLRPLWLNAGPR